MAKSATKTLAKAGTKPVADAVAEPAAKPAANEAAKSPAKRSVKAPAKSPAKSPAKTAAAKPAAKPAAKTSATPPTQPPAKPAAKAAPAKKARAPRGSATEADASVPDGPKSGPQGEPKAPQDAALPAPARPAKPAKAAKTAKTAKATEVPEATKQPKQLGQPKSPEQAKQAKRSAQSTAPKAKQAPGTNRAPAAAPAADGAVDAAAAAPASTEAAGHSTTAAASTATAPATTATSAAATTNPNRRKAPAADKSAPADAPAAPAHRGPPHSAVRLVAGDQHQLLWQAGSACPPALAQAMSRRVDAQGHLPLDDDEALPWLMRQTADAGHALQVDAGVWPLLAAHRDARSRCAVLAAAYPDGPSSPALAGLLAVPLPLFQAEGALWSVVAGRALLADEPGLGKGVQAMAALRLWQRHFGLQRVVVVCTPAQRLVWQHGLRQLAGLTAQVMAGGLHQRQAQWSTDAELRILAPEALASDAAHLRHWAPDLVIVDEPQRLGLDDAAWAALHAPHALVLCGAALDRQPALLAQLVAWLDAARLGPLAALHRIQAAREQGQLLSDEALDEVSQQLSRLLLQRQRSELQDQLPPVVYSPRLVAMGAAQQAAHGQALAQARRLLAGWQRSGFMADADQWRLSEALGQLLASAHRADPDDPASPLADGLLQAAEAWAEEAEDDPVDEGAGDGADAAPALRLVLCDSAADARQLRQRLTPRPGLQVLGPDDAVPGTAQALLQVGVPWRPRRHALGPRGQALQGQVCTLLVAQGSLDEGLLATLGGRSDTPRGPAEPGGRGFLSGARLDDWLRAVAAAVQAVPAEPATDAG